MANVKITRRGAIGSVAVLAGISLAKSTLAASAGERLKDLPSLEQKVVNWPRSVSADDELLQVIRKALASTGTTRELDELLTHFLDVLPLPVALNLRSDIWINVSDAVASGDQLRSLILGEVHLPKNLRLRRHTLTRYTWETQAVKRVVYAGFWHSDMADIWHEVRKAASSSVLAPTTAPVLTDDLETAKALFCPRFFPTLLKRIAVKADEVLVEFRAETELGVWQPN